MARARGKSTDLIDVIEAAYAVDRDEQQWLKGLVDAAAPLIGRGLGTIAYTYDASSMPMKVGTADMRGGPIELHELGALLASADEGYVNDGWRATALATASEIPGFAEQPAVRDYLRPRGVGDVLAINACDVSGLGVWLGAPLPEITRLGSAERAVWSRVAAHMAAAFRLRRDLAGSAVNPSHADAVLSPSGKLAHAERDAKLDASREALRRAAVALERARGALRRKQPTEAVELWRVLASARWSLIDHFDSDGKRFVLAVQNAPAVHGPDVLTEREKQVVAFAAMGHTNKVIAYELGIADSTVRVLLARASEKLAAESRRELVAIYRAHAAAGRA